MDEDLQKNADFSRRDVGILWPEEFCRAVSMRRFRPSEPLTPFVAHHFVASWSLPEGQSYEISDVLSLPAVHLLLTDSEASIVGVMGERRTLTLQGDGSYAGVRFTPGGFFPFYGRSLVGLRNRRGAASEVFPQVDAAFAAQTLSLAKPETIAARLDSLLMSVLPQDDQRLGQIRRVLADIERDPLRVTPEQLSKRHNLSLRGLQNLATQYLGVGVKWVVIHQRIVKAIELAHREEKPNWTRIAHDLDYSSQSHFNNEFKKIVGVPPTTYWKRIRDPRRALAQPGQPGEP